MAADPYTVLGIPRTASDEEVRTAYRRLVKATHPDHNGGSPEAAKRFEAVQEAYAEIQRLRRTRGAGAADGRAAGSARRQPPPHSETPDPAVDARLSDLERQVREAAKKAEKAARKAAARASAAGAGDTKRRPTDEELGYITTDDSFWKILSDARTELGERLEQARSEPVDHPVAKRVSDLIDGLEALTDKLDRKPKR
jgi:curved DNA-binding protein CbpA